MNSVIIGIPEHVFQSRCMPVSVGWKLWATEHGYLSFSRHCKSFLAWFFHFYSHELCKRNFCLYPSQHQTVTAQENSFSHCCDVFFFYWQINELFLVLLSLIFWGLQTSSFREVKACFNHLIQNHWAYTHL